MNYLFVLDGNELNISGNFIDTFDTQNDLPTTAPTNTYNEGDVAIVKDDTINSQTNAIWSITTRTPGFPDDTYIWSYTGENNLQASDAVSISERLDERLDIGYLEVPFQSNNNEIPRLVDLDIYAIDNKNPIKVFNFIVSSSEVEIQSREPLLYKNKISIIERTKLLEKEISKELTFTQPTDGTIDYYLDDVIDRVLWTSPTLTSSDVVTYGRKFSLSTELRTILETIESPNYFFSTTTTIREILIDILKYINAVPRLNKNNEIVADFYNETKELIDKSVKSVDETLSSEILNYATTIRSDIKNVLNEYSLTDSTIVHPNENGFVLAQNAPGQLQGDLSFIQLPLSISTISSVKVFGSFDFIDPNAGGAGVNLQEVEIGDRIFEKDIWDLFQLSASDFGTGGDTNEGSVRTNTNYQVNSLYYSYKNNKIEGLTNTANAQGDIIAIEKVIANAVWRQFGYINGQILTPTNELLYRITFTPLFDARVDLERKDLTSINKNTTIIQNQPNRVITLENYTNNLYGNIQRLGNEDLQISQLLLDFDDIFNIGDFTSDNFIVTERELFFYNDYFKVKYGLTKNFNRVSQFVGINNEFRPYELPQDRKVDSNTIYKDYVEIGFNDGTSNNSSLTSNGVEVFMDTFEGNTLSQPQTVALRTYTTTESAIPRFIPSTTEYILRSLTSNGGTNSLIFTFGFDNVSNAGWRNVDGGNILGVTDARILQGERYTDVQGQFDTMTFSFVDDLDITYDALNDAPNGKLTFARNFPRIDKDFGVQVDEIVNVDNTLLTITDLEVYKDKSSVTKVTYEIILVPKQSRIDNIVIGRGLGLFNSLVTEDSKTLKLYTYDTEEYKELENLTVKPADNEYDFTPNVTVVGQSLLVNLSRISGKSAYAIGDTDGNLYLAVNQKGTNRDTITFDFKNRRGGIDYS